MNLLDAEVLSEIDPVGPRDRRAWFALRMRPRVPASERGVQVVLAIDRSSSMRGAKLEQARLAATVLVEMLRDEDQLAILAFDEHVRVMLPPHRADARGKIAARLVIAGVQAGRGTALHDAAKQSLALANELPSGHAILITDGFPFSGITDASQIIAMVGADTGRATLSTVGVGSDLDASLLAAMAGVGGGRFLHVDAGGDLVGTLGGELATVRGAVTGRIQLRIRGARGVAITTAPHYAAIEPAAVRSAGDGRSLATATLAPAVLGEERLVAFELSWERSLEVGAHHVALVTVEVGLPGSASPEHLELPVRLTIGAARGAMSPVVTLAACELMAGRALHQAALGEDPQHVLDRVLSDAAGWIRGRASAAGLDPGRDLGPTLHVLAIAQLLFQNQIEDAPLLRAYAEGIAKHYDAAIGTGGSVLCDLRTRTQMIGCDAALRTSEIMLPVK